MRNWFSRAVISIVVLLLTTGVFSATAQEDDAPLRDPQALAARYFGFSGEIPTPPLTPAYEVGDEAQFWVGKAGGDAPVRVNATLAASTPVLYLWLEDGVRANANLTETAVQLSQIMIALRQRDNYRQPLVDPQLGTLTDPTDLLPIPDVDNDEHLYILFTTHLSADRETILNPLDSQPVEYAPYSNQHEMLYVDTEQYAGIALDDPLYLTIIIRGMYSWIMTNNAPQQADWLTDTLNWSVLLNLQQSQVDAGSLNAFLQAPDYPLFQRSTLTAQSQALGGQQLFLGYFLQRHGAAPLIDLFLQQGSGIIPLDAVLARHDVTDPVNGSIITARDIFADFVMTNALDIGFGDGRYMQTAVTLPEGQTAASTELVPGTPAEGQSVSQFGAQYYHYAAPADQTVTLGFDGASTTARLPMPADRDSADTFYWSGRVEDANPTLTRPIDLSGVETAMLTFDVWYDFAQGWNYGYVSVSDDDGATWTALRSTSSSVANQYGIQYGAGFTGISNPSGAHPFPTIGVVIEGDGMTISDLVAGGAAEQAGVLRGDRIIGYDSEVWTSAPNVIALLANYQPGDTLNLYIQRGQQRLDIPVVLGAHPTRVVEPEPLWLAQTVDLSDYAGGQILLRFESVTLPGHEDQGFAVDNLAIPEIEWADSADGSDADWISEGWSTVDNQVAQRWIVQVASGGSQTTYPRVLHLISPADVNTPSIEQKIDLVAGEILVLAVSGANDDTAQRANFGVSLQQESMQ
jgi:hypothetical protein